MSQGVLDKWGAMRAELDRRAAEIERLQAALQELASDAYHDDDYQVIARRALAEHAANSGPLAANNTTGPNPKAK